MQNGENPLAPFFEKPGIGAGRLAQTNADQVTQVRKIIEGLGLEIASSDA